ncbi:MAG: [protein-PII] uridylyltransferase [Rhodocyclaceae bacterium]|jgi:[protein-PII] uridylyltransferase|nr:Bifunctional uridylyltransferase/uridylyl-removing enzyme [Rhodocyclaceae bacterium]MCC6878496.1 [protein-PII] uridylyltransferase [Rhodocyclaceae bacterium]MCL4681143.1 [protein-PII] uridylyltransferase [Rhodocyclaceae bacterium]
MRPATSGDGLPPLRQRASRLREELVRGQAALKAAYEAGGDAARLLRGRCQLVDDVLKALWLEARLPLGLSLVAVGGYGRRELFPASDVDLLFLLPDNVAGETERQLEELIGLLWDIGLDIGHSVRTVWQCVDEAARDITVQTNLLEARLVCGSRNLYAEFGRQMRARLDPGAFYKGKRLEQDERHVRYQETPYALEPNCKESPGGLRDLQVILWISRTAGLGDSWSDLARRGFITRGEARQLKGLETFLRHLRIRLHHLTGRREDRLLFDHQEAIARQFGIAAGRTRRAAELLMQRYYRAAKSVTQLNTILLQNLGADIFPEPNKVPIVINERFQMDHELLDVRDGEVFERTPAAILESFLLMAQRPELKGMTARTLRALWRARRLVGPDFRRDAANRAAFLKLFQQKRGLLHELRRMNQYGILGRYIPAFRRIVCQMQHDLFHVYTVDQHILMVVRNLRRFALPEFAHEYPFCSRLFAELEKPWLLYVAALFHDIAKGRGGDHSKLGMADARRFCREHGLAEADTALVVWLVEHHLSMSNVAQKQDLADPEVVRAFAGLVGDEYRLAALYLLTVADIRGTSPKVWNGWKGKLLEDLYNAALRLLRGATPQQAMGIAERQEDARRLLRYFGLRQGVEGAFWKELDTVYFLRHDAEEIAWHTRSLYHRPAPEQPVVKARLPHIGDEGLQVMVYVQDRPHLFARLCGFFSRLGYSIAEAKIHTTRHGYALDSFMLLDPDGTLAYRDMISLIEHELAARLASDAPPDKQAGGRLSRQVRHFPITPEVQIRPTEKTGQCLLTIVAADRPGLLFTVASTLDEHGLNVHTAKIATLGERVEDTFLVSGAELAKTATLLRLETELLERLQV